MASEPTLSSLAMLASSVDQAHASDSSNAVSPAQKTKEQMRRHYVRALHKVIDESDIVILVLDARDPEGCRSRLVEEEVRRREAEGKKLVFVLNKIGARVFLPSCGDVVRFGVHGVDLVPRENAQQWLRYLRHYTADAPIPFGRVQPAVEFVFRDGTIAASAFESLQAERSPKCDSRCGRVSECGCAPISRWHVFASNTVVSIWQVCAVAAQPGHTRDLQTVQLERGLKMIDSPGVVFDEDEDESAISQRQRGSILLRNVIKVEDIEDPIAVVEEILLRTERATLQKIYGLPEFSNTLEFLTMLALSSGRLHKGGTPDVLSAARQVLMDWNHQKIPYFSVPPVIHPSMIPTTISSATSIVAPGAETVGQAQILTELSKPFELAGLFGAADTGAFASEDAHVDEVMRDDTAEHEAEMVADDTPLRIPLKRSHSPGSGLELGVGTAQRPTYEPSYVRTPKRFRRAKDLSAYELAAAESHPLHRKTLKKGAKRARRAATRLERRPGHGGMGMEVEVELQNTFMTGSNDDDVDLDVY
ncbi:hypothetical protein J3R82DRAFT_7852 [Butyriboletus roseoflavus]|nr:hypothetical protein J3R82DRAFT_7852 [Butyriboletus roseoflavus]